MKKKYISPMTITEIISPYTLLSGSVDWGGSAVPQPGETGGIGSGNPEEELGTSQFSSGDYWDDWD